MLLLISSRSFNKKHDFEERTLFFLMTRAWRELMIGNWGIAHALRTLQMKTACGGNSIQQSCLLQLPHWSTRWWACSLLSASQLEPSKVQSRHCSDCLWSETGRIRFRRVWFRTPNSVSFSALTEFRGESSVSSSRPIICVPKRTHRVFSQNSPSLP